MSETKHTKGPWAVGEMEPGVAIAPGELCIHVPGDSREFDKSDGTRHAVIVCRGMDGPTREANAALIAAAPSLLEALEGIVEDASPQVSMAEARRRWDARYAAALAAIKLARGEQ